VELDGRQLDVHIQVAYFVLALAGYVVLRAPSDGGTGPY
jgi:hypothetical protein